MRKLLMIVALLLVVIPSAGVWGQEEWIAPTGVVTDTIGNPVFQWKSMAGAITYSLYVGKGSTGVDGPVFYEQSLQTSMYCSGETCSVRLTDIIPPTWLANGVYAAYIKPDNGDWKGPFEFTINVAAPAAPTLGTITNTNGSTPTLNWTLEGDATKAAFFQVYVAPSLTVFVPSVYQWVTREEACGSWTGTSCTWTPPAGKLAAGYSYQVYMNSWGAGGLSVGGNVAGVDGWVTSWFNLGGPAPAIPQNVKVSLQGFTPVITWDDDPNTTSYTLAILFPNGSVLVQEVDKTLAACDGTKCSYSIAQEGVQITSGEYKVYAQPKGPGGTRGDGLLNQGWFEMLTVTIP